MIFCGQRAVSPRRYGSCPEIEAGTCALAARRHRMQVRKPGSTVSERCGLWLSRGAQAKPLRRSPGAALRRTQVHSRSAGRAVGRLLPLRLRFSSLQRMLRHARHRPRSARRGPFKVLEAAVGWAYTLRPHAVVAELADALDSGSSGVTPMEVQVLSTALHAGPQGPACVFGPSWMLDSACVLLGGPGARPHSCMVAAAISLTKD